MLATGRGLPAYHRGNERGHGQRHFPRYLILPAGKSTASKATELVMITRETWFRVPISRRANRLLHGGIVIGLAIGLIVCATIEPDPSGTGTHTQLGLPPCLVCQFTGLEHCPSCGLTTGLAHLVRGHWSRAAAVHRAAPTVFFVGCVILLHCVIVTILGKNWLAQELSVLSILCVAGFFVWLVAICQLSQQHAYDYRIEKSQVCRRNNRSCGGRFPAPLLQLINRGREEGKCCHVRAVQNHDRTRSPEQPGNWERFAGAGEITHTADRNRYTAVNERQRPERHRHVFLQGRLRDCGAKCDAY